MNKLCARTGIVITFNQLQLYGGTYEIGEHLQRRWGYDYYRADVTLGDKTYRSVVKFHMKTPFKAIVRLLDENDNFIHTDEFFAQYEQLGLQQGSFEKYARNFAKYIFPYELSTRARILSILIGLPAMLLFTKHFLSIFCVVVCVFIMTQPMRTNYYYKA